MGSKKRREISSIIVLLWLFTACSLEFLQMQTSLLAVDMPIPVLSLPRFLLNLSLIFFVHFLVRLISGRWSVSFYLSAAFFFLWATADYYTICYHGSPLFFSELGNIKAALALSGSYKLHFHWIPGLNLLIFGSEMITSYFLCRIFTSQNREPRKEQMSQNPQNPSDSQMSQNPQKASDSQMSQNPQTPSDSQMSQNLQEHSSCQKARNPQNPSNAQITHNPRNARNPLLYTSLSAASLLVFVTGFYLLHVLVNDYILGWKWYDNVRDYGFICCTAEDFCNTLFPYTSDDPFKDNPILALEKDYSNASTGEEKDYSNASSGKEKDYSNASSGKEKDHRKVLTETKTKTGSRSRKEENEAPFPDIILIVNESFYDLAAQSNLQTDQDYLKDYYSIEGALYGFAECPNIGGRTNDSEYELLTGCSMDRLRASAPFNYMDLTQGPSLVRFLKKLGYETTAMHCGQPRIYSRDTGYRQLGFDHVILGEEHFPHHSWNGNREWLDEDNYKDLITCYERQGSGPRFFYLMTYQNHGSYDQNDSSQDTVHPIGCVKGTVLSDTSTDMSSKSVKGTVLGDTPTDMSPSTDQPTQQSTLLGPQTQEETAEYLSSIFLSARAIHRLTDYLAHRSRPVVVCMIGDHAPPLISQLPPRSSDREAGLREVPFMIWNNAGIDFSFRPSAQPSDQKALSTASIPFAYPADQAKIYRDLMGWKDQGLDMTEIMADLFRCVSECVIGDGSL